LNASKITSPPKVFVMISLTPPSNLLLKPETKPTPNRLLTLLVKRPQDKRPNTAFKRIIVLYNSKKKELTENK
jgi:hypothetical protein